MHKHNNKAFTILELVVVIACLGILIVMSIISYSGWRTRLAEAQIKNDLLQMASAMENARNFGTGYPASLPTTFQVTSGSSLSLAYSNTDNYCIDGTVSQFSVSYYIRSSVNAMSPLQGSCNDSYVASNLLLYLDAGRTSSYIGTGTTWTDLSGNNRNGTLVNGVGYSSSNGGSLTFDGVNDAVTLPDGIESSYSYNSTMEIWARQTTNKDVEYFKIGTGVISSPNESGLWYTANTMNYYFYITAAGDRPFIKATYSANIADSKWYQIVGTFAGNSTSGTAKIYINGQLINTSSSITTTSSLGNPGFSSASAYAMAGNISIARLYNRALTDAEVLQNFNSAKDRYGL